MRHSEYPPPRGACVSLDDRRYLITGAAGAYIDS